MKAACITVVIVIAIGIGVWSAWSCSRQSLMPAPTAPEAPQWSDAKPPKAPAPEPKPQPTAATAAFPPSREPPLYGLPLVIRMSAPDVPPEIAEPSPPRAEQKPADKPRAAKPPTVKKS